MATWCDGLPTWGQPRWHNLPVLLWPNLLEAWDLESYAKARYQLLGSGGHWFAGANADALDDGVSKRCVEGCSGGQPLAKRIPDIP